MEGFLFTDKKTIYVNTIWRCIISYDIQPIAPTSSPAIGNTLFLAAALRLTVI